MILAATLALALNGAATPQQGLNDARLVNIRDGSADVWLALDVQPSGLDMSAEPGVLVLRLDGGRCAPREIIAPADRPVSHISLAGEGEGGCALRLQGQWETASARLAEGGIIVTLEGVSPVASSPVLAAAAPARSPVQETPAEPAGGAAGETERTESQLETAAGTSASGGTAVLATGPDGPCEQTGGRLEDTPWDLGAMAAHASCLSDAGQPRDAETLYERVLAFEPGHFAAALGLARIRADAGEVEEARELFETAAAAARTDGEALAARSAAEALRSASE